MLNILHLSDPHFHSSWEDNKEVTAKLEYIGNEFPDHKLIVTGDIVDDGYGAQYRRALEAFQPFIGRIFICPGNHDFGRKGNLYSKNCVNRFDKLMYDLGHRQKYGSHPIVHVLKDEDNTRGIMLIGLSSAIRSKDPFDFACGRIGWLQRRRLDRILMNPETIGMRKIVYFHHHPFEWFSFFGQMLDARKLIRLLSAKCEVVLFGHKHKSDMWTKYNYIDYILSAADLRRTKMIREISVDKEVISVQEHSIG